MPGPNKTITIFGASGRTGRVLAEAAIARSWKVRAFVRPSSERPPESEALTIVTGELDDPDALREAIAPSDAVCCVYGPHPTHPDVFCAQATRCVIEAMTAAGVRRLICQTGAMVGERLPNRGFWFERMARTFNWREPEAAEDRRLQETIVQASDREWTILKPPRLTDDRPSGNVRLGSELKIGLCSKLSRSDLAECILNEVESPRFIRQVVFVVG